MMRKALNVSLVLAAAVVSLGIGGALAPFRVEAKTPPVYATGKEQVALKGYDPVAFFVAGKPIKGDAQFKATHSGATWFFSSADNRDSFLAEPTKYAPQYGGYCAWAVSEGYTAPADPTVWKIV
jgi:YHS domain-containing protein